MSETLIWNRGHNTIKVTIMEFQGWRWLTGKLLNVFFKRQKFATTNIPWEKTFHRPQMIISKTTYHQFCTNRHIGIEWWRNFPFGPTSHTPAAGITCVPSRTNQIIPLSSKQLPLGRNMDWTLIENHAQPLTRWDGLAAPSNGTTSDLC